MNNNKKKILKKWSYSYFNSMVGGWKHKTIFKDISNFLIFIGYPRSGHSLIGALLDAHPNMVISNQLNALSLFTQDFSKNQIYYLIWENAYKAGVAGRSNSGYNYQVPNQWQGKARDIFVIGDKGGGKSSKILADQNHANLLDEVSKKVKVPLKMIHVIRNPFDNISTMITRATRNGRPFDESLFQKKINLYFNKAETNAALITKYPNQVHSIYFEQFVLLPAKELEIALQFIGTMVPSDYLKDCASIVWSKPNQSRFKVDFWTKERIQLVEEKKQQYKFLEKYSYE